MSLRRPIAMSFRSTCVLLGAEIGHQGGEKASFHGRWAMRLAQNVRLL